MMAMAEFTLSTTVDMSYEDTVAKVRELLGEAGFGVLTEIDMSAVLKAKLDIDTPPRIILGACRPPLAHRAVEADPRIAALLPCNAVVASEGEGRTRVDVFDPVFMTSFVDSPDLAEVAAEARERLSSVIEGLNASGSAAGAA